MVIYPVDLCRCTVVYRSVYRHAWLSLGITGVREIGTCPIHGNVELLNRRVGCVECDNHPACNAQACQRCDRLAVSDEQRPPLQRSCSGE